MLSSAARSILTFMNNAGYEAFLVGGAVRDLCMGLTPGDLDVTTNALPEEIKTLFQAAGYTTVDTGIKHGTVTVLWEKDCPVEITTYRKDDTYTDHRHPDGVRFTSSLGEDLSRRDFTMNALAMDKEEHIIDLFRGREDIHASRICSVGEAEKRFREDALRILRALRFSSVLGFSIDKQTKEAIHKEHDLRYVSGERIRTELLKLLGGKNCEEVLTEYGDVMTSVFPVLLPEWRYEQKGAKHRFDVYAHSAHVVAGVNRETPEMAAFLERVRKEWEAVMYSFGEERGKEGILFEPLDPVLLLSALFHDIGKPLVGRVKEDGTHDFKGHGKVGGEAVCSALDRLKPDKETHRAIRELISVHDDKVKPEKPEIKRRMATLGQKQWLRFLLLKSADQHGLNEAYWGEEGLLSLWKLTAEILAGKEPYRISDLAVTGADLLEAGVPEGPALGEALGDLLEQVITDRIPNEKTALLSSIGGKKR